MASQHSFVLLIFSTCFLAASPVVVNKSEQVVTTPTSTTVSSNGGSTLPGYMNHTDWDKEFCKQMHCEVGTSVTKEDCEARGQTDGHLHRWLPHGGFSQCCPYCIMLKKESEPCFADLDPSNPWPHDHHTCEDGLFCDKSTSRCAKK